MLIGSLGSKQPSRHLQSQVDPYHPTGRLKVADGYSTVRRCKVAGIGNAMIIKVGGVTMPNGPGDPKECRQYAARCRELADQTNDPLLQKAYLDVAESWRKLADELERLRILAVP
jgi:hypothetical protein